MRLLLLTSHSIAEHDDLDMLTRMGVDVFSIGAYSDPHWPTDDKRPALPNAPLHDDLMARCDHQREIHRDDDASYVIDWAKGDLAQGVIDWADAIVVHHFPEQWVGGNWARIRDKRVIWRTCGQSDPRLEAAMSRYTRDGLQVVRYSPREREVFTRLGHFAGEDALIRFGKDPEQWSGWHGSDRVVGNITQHMAQRGDACGYGFWGAATDGLPVEPAGPGSEALRGGIGALSYDEMREYLRRVRCYLYTGTRPASYTLGLIEAMMTGVPVVSIGSHAFGCEGLFEEIGAAFDHADEARVSLARLLTDEAAAAHLSEAQRATAIELFGLEAVSRQWADFLGLDRYTSWGVDATPYFGEVAS